MRGALTPRGDHDARRLSAGVLFAVAPCWYVLTEAVSASAFEGYSYAHNYISDLGVPAGGVLDGRVMASTLPHVMNAGFIGSGLLFALGVVRLWPTLPHRRARLVFAGLAAAHAIGIAVVGIVPGSPENVANGRIALHGLGAVAAIAGGNLAAIASSRAFADTPSPTWIRRAGLALGSLGLASGLALSTHRIVPDGVWERGGVYAFMLWQAAVGVSLLTERRRRRRT